MLNLTKELRITPLFERFLEMKSNGTLVDPTITAEALVIDLLESVKVSREDKKVQKLLKEMDLHHPNACVDSIRWNVGRTGITTREANEYNTCDWIRSKQSMIFIGPTGAGKTYLADCFAVSAITAGFKVFYKRTPLFLAELQDITSAAQMMAFFKTMQSYDLIYLDDFGCGTLSEHTQALISELADKCINKVSFLLTSQNKASSWIQNYFLDAEIAEAFCDRIYKPAIRFELDGPSLRDGPARKVAKVQEQKPTEPPAKTTDNLPLVNSKSAIEPSNSTNITTKRKRGRPRKNPLTTENNEVLLPNGSSGKNGNNGALPLSGNNGNLPKLPKDGD